MKEDILEQLVEEYLQHKGYFTRHNEKFRPDPKHRDYVSSADAVASDIDVIGIHPKLRGPERCLVVGCKSWQRGFNPQSWITAIEEDKVRSGRQAWQAFRELTQHRWAEAFCDRIESVTGTRSFVYVTAVTRVLGARSIWEEHEPFRKLLRGTMIRVLTVEDILRELVPMIGTTPAGSDIGRLLQILKASGAAPLFGEREAPQISAATTPVVAGAGLRPKKPTGGPETVAAVVRELVQQGKSNAEIWAIIQPKFQLNGGKRHYPAWYRAEMKRNLR